MPPERVIVPSLEALSPAPAAGLPFASNGGHAVAHAPEHALFMPTSALNRYSVAPVESTRIRPKRLLETRTVVVRAGVAVGVGVDAEVDGGGDAVAPAPPPHAATARATSGTSAAPARTVIGRLRVMSAPSVREHRQSQRRAVIESRNT